jgi:hypothetical protein
MIITPKILEKAMLTWGKQYRNRQTMAHEDADALPLEENAEQGAAHLWLLLKHEKKTLKGRGSLAWLYFRLLTSLSAVGLLVLAIYQKEHSLAAFALVILVGARQEDVADDVARVVSVIAREE